MPLDYDNSAFFYFSLSICSLYLVPGTLYAARRLLSIFSGSSTKHLEARTKLERQKVKHLHEQESVLKRVFTPTFLAHLILLALTWLLFVKLIFAVLDVPEIATFDPYAILNLDVGAEDRLIKRQYRKLSLQYHPDKNQNNPEAEQKFMMIAKAYEALTNEAARANYEKYGNPDGRQSLEVSIGLPTFFKDKDHHNLILVIYLMGLCIVIPSVVGLWYSKSKQYGDNNILYDTYGYFNFTLSENAHVKLMPEILAGAAEYRSIPLKDGDQEELLKLLRELKGDTMAKPKYQHPHILKTNILLHAFLHRKPLTRSLQNDLNKILLESPRLIDAMLEISVSRSWFQTSLNIIEFAQYLSQGIWVKDSPLLQIPHFSEYEVKHATSGKAGVKSLLQYIRADPEKRKGTANFNDEQMADVNSALKAFPDIKLECTAVVEDEETIAVGDLISLKVKLIRQNVPEGQKAPEVYSERYPHDQKERWMVLVGNLQMNKMMSLVKITSQEREAETKINFAAPPQPGQYSVDVIVKCDSYVGLDLQESVKFTVISADELPKFEVHPEDAALDDEPSLFDQVLGNPEDTDSEVEFDDDEDDDDESTSKKTLQKKKESSTKAIKSKDAKDGVDDAKDGEEGTELKGKM